MKIKVIASLCGVFFPAIVFADCPDNLGAEKMAECVTIEGSGANYQDWQKNEYAFNLDTEDKSMISPITGTDIRTIQPAAGGERKQ